MDVNTTDLSGNTLLMIAARNGNGALLDYLLRNRANTLKRNKYGDTALMLAVFQGRTEIVRRMLDAKVQISGGGWNPLHYAAFGGHAEIAAMLMDRVPDIDAPAPNGQTALMLAAAAGHLDVVKVLVDADADMDLEDYEGLTAIALAIKAGRESVVGYLRSEGADE